jgi:hypothetical protein
MNAETARTLIPLYRHDRPADSKIKKAVQFADSDPALGQELKSQLEFDRRIVDVIRCLKPSSSLKEKLGGTNGRPSSKARQVMNPAVLCAVVGVLLLIGIGIHLKLEADKDFPGRPWVEDFIKLNEHMTGAELEQTESRAGDLGDNAMLRGFDGFSLPSEIGAQQAVGWRVFRHGPSGHKVVQIVVERDNSIIFVFRSSDFGVQPGATGDWRFFEYEGWAAAIRQFHQLCVLVTFRGKEADMRKMIQSVQQP